jgi:hypothetical protein
MLLTPVCNVKFYNKVISEMEIKCAASAISCLVKACCPVLTQKGRKNPEKSLPTESLFPGRGLNSRTSTYEAACRPFECDNSSGFLLPSLYKCSPNLHISRNPQYKICHQALMHQPPNSIKYVQYNFSILKV